MLAVLMPSKAAATRLITFEEAARHGLQRAWFAQVSVDVTRGRVSHWTLFHDQLFSLSTSGTLQAMNAETGKTLWTVRVGAPDGVFAGPSVNEKVVALTSGTKLYVMDRDDGHVLFTRSLGSASAAAPALSEQYAFVTLINGQIEAYPLEDSSLQVWYHQSAGRIFYSATVTGDLVSWPTDRGFLYVAQADGPRVLHRVETNAEIVAPPAELAPLLFVTSRDGYLYCLQGLTGAEQWRFSTGYPIVKKPAVVADTSYVASQEPALHAVNSQTGERLWSASGATQFVAEGAKHVYALDRYGTLFIVESESGGIIGRINVGDGATALVNDQSDRIFLVSERGLVQCLHETDSPEPTYYRLQPVDIKPDDEEETAESPFVEETPAQEFTIPEPTDQPEVPFEPPEEDDDNPFF